ncbi:SDR family NAD(P)-dependent oxidoreductase [Abyssibacter profundi]|nr:SDR family NAD(P)-dependent oxidoreductase [Abyssibacter profundi]MBV62159.1 short-chain dehydrogenase [Nevskiales bacterium]
MSKDRISGRKILITGASSGIGRAGAIQLAERGAEVLLMARRAEELDAVVTDITAAGGKASAFPIDLTDAAAVDTLMTSIHATHGKIDVLINNAGRSIRRSATQSLERLHDYDRCMQINYFAPLRLIHHVLPPMLEAGDGHVINVLTWGTLMPAAYFSAYTASKSALGAAAQGMDAELRSQGVAFTGLHYPLVHTAMSAPTEHYKSMPGMSTKKAGSWMVKAVKNRPARIAPPYAVAAGLGNTLLPGPSASVAGRLKF